MSQFLQAVMSIDVQSCIFVLFLGNMTSVILVATYRFSPYYNQHIRLSHYYLPAKLFQGFAFLLLFGRGIMPDVLSVNLGNTLLMIGFFLEAMTIAVIAESDSRRDRIVLATITGVCVVVFNFVEMVYPDSSLRVVVSSSCVFTIMVIPNLRLVLPPGVSLFKRMVGLFYMIFLALLLPRAGYALFYPISILTNFYIQSMTFVVLILLLIYSLPAYLLLMKENADKAITIMATTDCLTSMANRFSFLDRAEELLRRQAELGLPVSVLFLDIDHFKLINDQFGHGFGDEVLVRLASLIRDSLRGHDLSCRYGGEEFVVALPDADFDNVRGIAERIMTTVRETQFGGQVGFHFTVSIGVAVSRKGEDDLEEIINRADEAMYKAKKNGRNRIEFYAPTA